MNSLKTIVILLFVSLFASCGKGDSDTSFKCKIDGTAYETDGLLAYGVKDDTNLIFYGVKGDGSNQQSILVWIPATAKAGDTFTDKSDFRIDYTDGSQKTFSTHLSDKATGSVTLKSVSATTATGTFEAVIYDIDTHTTSKKITAGTFDIVFR